MRSVAHAEAVALDRDPVEEVERPVLRSAEAGGPHQDPIAGPGFERAGAGAAAVGAEAEAAVPAELDDHHQADIAHMVAVRRDARARRADSAAGPGR